jgi:hypothetical protein
MPAQSIAQSLAQVRGQLDHACDRLVSPTAASLDACARDLESAVRQFTDFQPELRGHGGDAEALEQAWHVRRSFLRARKLMESAAAFHENWTRLRGTISGGYTATGDPGPVTHPRRICLQA